MFIIYSKGESCPFCIKAKGLLKAKKQEFKEILVPEKVSREDFIEIITPFIKDGKSMTFPQIFKDSKICDENYIGGFDELRKYTIAAKL